MIAGAASRGGGGRVRSSKHSAATGAPTSAATSVRSTGVQPWAQRVADAELADAVAEAALEFDKEEGTLGVLVPHSRLDAVAAAAFAWAMPYVSGLGGPA